jgi:hypothetical protein
MNCPQCQTANGPDAAFCGNCGARLAVASAPSAAGGYPPASGTPLGYSPAGAPTGYGAPAGYDAAAGYGAPGYQNTPPGYGPAGDQGASGYMQNQYQQGQYPSAGSNRQAASSTGFPPVNFDLTRLSTVDRIVAGATFVTMISLWLPWFDATYLGQSIGSISGTGDHGWLWLEFILALALLGYLAARAAWEQLPFSLPVSHERLLIAGTGLQFLLILIGFVALPSTDGLQGFSVSWDFGAFLALIASIVAAGPVVYPTVRSYLDSRNAGASRAS